MARTLETRQEGRSRKKGFNGFQRLLNLALAVCFGFHATSYFSSSDGFRLARKVAAEDLLILSAPVLAVVNDSNQETVHPSGHSTQSGNVALGQQHPAADDPLVSFIIPTRLDRQSLNRTLHSLLNQTFPNWEAIVGVDVARTKSNRTIARASQFAQDSSRIRYRNIQTTNPFRGRKGNGSARVRNEIIKQFARAHWVAFVDDDDTLSPYYVEILLESIQESTNADIILFRMQGFPEPTSLLPPPNVSHLYLGDFGISFAVRKRLFVERGMVFVPHPSEDYFYVRTAHQQGAVVKLSTCTLYFVQQPPHAFQEKPSCAIQDDVEVTFSDTGKIRPK